MRIKVLLFLFLFSGVATSQTVADAISTDPLADIAHRASSTELAIPSHGEQLLGIFYAAGRAGNHPTVVLLHGFPGYEQNLDLAQAIRRAGWNVLAMHYRGSWGVGGDFSLAHAMEDADAMVAWARSPAAAEKFHIDRNRIVVIGHSMGGFMTAFASAHEPGVMGAVMIGTWDITAPVRDAQGKTRDQLIAQLDQHSDSQPEDFLPLHSFTPHDLAVETVDHAGEWDLAKLAPAIASRPVLLLTANDGSDPGSARFEQALKAAGDKHVLLIHTDTDHGFNGQRIHLETMVLEFLQRLPRPSPR